jgi:hypothetical protein
MASVSRWEYLHTSVWDCKDNGSGAYSDSRGLNMYQQNEALVYLG